jgi:hypothetical protein
VCVCVCVCVCVRVCLRVCLPACACVCVGGGGGGEGAAPEALLGVELQQADQQVARVARGVREEVLDALGLHRAARLHHGGGEGRLDRVQVLGGGPPRELHDAVQLVHGGGAGEDGLAGEQLAQDAACRYTGGRAGGRAAVTAGRGGVPGLVGDCAAASPSCAPAGCSSGGRQRRRPLPATHTTRCGLPKATFPPTLPIAALEPRRPGPATLLAPPRWPGPRTAGPHVDAVGVARRAQQDLWRPVPARGHVVRQDGVVAVGRVELRHRARQPKVRQLDLALAVEQQVAGLQGAGGGGGAGVGAGPCAGRAGCRQRAGPAEQAAEARRARRGSQPPAAGRRAP